MIRWTFFFEEGNVKSDVKEEKEDERIAEFIDNNRSGWLDLPGDELDIAVNMAHVKCVVRQVVKPEDALELQPKTTAEEEKSA